MKVSEALSTAQDTITVKRVYGEPYEKDGLTIIPAAVVSGIGGGGHGQDESGQEGEGGGFGTRSRPAGAYVIKDGEVSWRMAIDVTRIVTMVGLVAIAYVLTRPRKAGAALRRG